MENKNNSAMYSVIFLVVGIFIGWLIWGSAVGNRMMNGGNMHQMQNGSMMQNDMMGMGDAMDSMMAGLYGKTGSEFDKAFIDEMIVHHAGAVDMAQLALKNADREEIKNMANAIISAQTKEIGQMKMWRTTWFGN